MFKRYVAFFTAVFFFITIFPIAITQRVQAYQNNAYFNNVKVGLVSMLSTGLTLTLNGDYTLNGQVYPSGSVINLGINGTSITLNGTLQSQITLNPNNSSNLLMITSGAVSNKYMGSFLIQLSGSKLLPINMIDIENYLKGVVGYEMSDGWPLESLKAQAVAARNYAISRVGYAAAKGYDFDDTAAYQVYKGLNANLENVINAVDQTRGQVLLYNNTLVETLYSAWHGGISENSENVWGNTVPYLRSVQDTYENLTWPNGNIIVTNSQIKTLLTTKGYLASTDTFLSLDLNSITKFASGRIANIKIIYKDIAGTTKTKLVINDNTRTFLSLPSNLYTVTYDVVNSAYTFSGKGNGHGLGMSQIGAKNRATAGHSYDQILKFYYQNSYLQNLILKANVSTLTQNKNFLYEDNVISFDTTATAGNGYGYLFKYVVKNGVNVVFTRDYSSTSTLDYVPSNPGSYTVSAFVKDKYSISDYDDTKDSSFTVYGTPVLNSFTLSSAITTVGEGVSTNVDVDSGSGSFLYKYEVSKDGNILATRDFLADKQFNYIPSQIGNYTITAYVKDSISINPYDFKQAQSFTAFNGLKITSITKDNQNVFVGDAVNLTSQVSGGSGKGIIYQYVVTKGGTVLLTQDFGTLNTLAFTPTQSGNYNVSVKVKDSLSGQAYDDINNLSFIVLENAKINTVQTNKSKYLTGQNVNLNVTASSGSGSQLYKYVVSKDGVTLSTVDYSNNVSLQYLLNNSGTYIITIYVKDTLSTKSYDDMKTVNIPVYTQPTMNYISTQSSILVGNPVKYSITEINGTGNAQYRFVVMKDSSLVLDSGY
ncbi:MAG: SpoIID/LytB domain-containing protein, partial [Clostridiaceae bacterium]|nr:SpoIID/LytB domain-containing protein [Clostridiaceae bacterium]